MPIEGYPNLINPAQDLTTEQRRANAVVAGQASGKARARRRLIADVALAILDSPETDPDLLAMLQEIGLEGTKRDSMTLAQVLRAIKGDPDSFRLVRDTIGEKPSDQVEIGGLADRPIATIDMTKLSDDELRALAELKSQGT